ncbi:MAG: hypothetical protein FWG71_09755, partial [Synergistaceae bacterium]|nr:hypothetical protein [Synergistaceae bacterium]
MSTMPEPNDLSHFKRPRLNRLLEEAVKCPVVVICAGAGYGKTRAVADFLLELEMPTAWEQLSDRDNVPSRAWENLAHSFAQVSEQMGEGYREFGFPDTEEKRKQFYRLYERSIQPYTLVLDDFHFLKNQAVLEFVEHVLYYMPSNRKTTIILSR